MNKPSTLSARVAMGSPLPSFNLARFDLVSLRLAVMCAELGSLSAATRRVNCAVSTGSYRLTGLEEMLNTALFIRDHQGLRMTEAGERFVLHAKAILERVELMNQELRMVSTPSSSLCVA